MNKIIGIYSDHPQEAEQKIRDVLEAKYNQPVLYTSTDNHTAYSRQYQIVKAKNKQDAQQQNIVKFGMRADFGEWETVAETDPERINSHTTNHVQSDVVIPYHAAAMPFVREAVDSILNQSFAEPVVHLIADGVDTDCDQVQKHYASVSNVRTYKNKQSGPYVAVNRVFDYLETEYITIMDADDIASPYRLCRAVNALEATGCGIYTASMEQFVDYRYHNSSNTQRLSTHPVIESGKKTRLFPTGTVIHGTQTCKKSVFENLHGYNDYFCGGDSHFAMRAQAAGVKIHYSKHIVAQRRLHARSLTGGVDYGVGSKARQALMAQMENDFVVIQSIKAEPCEFGTLQLHRNSQHIQRTN